MKDELINRITNKQAQVGVIGLGYVGLPLLVEFASKGFRAIGFEVDESKARRINEGQSYIGDVPAARLNEMVKSERLRATTDFNNLGDCDVIIICVPTPLRKTKEPDVSYILAAAEEIQKRLRRGPIHWRRVTRLGIGRGEALEGDAQRAGAVRLRQNMEG